MFNHVKYSKFDYDFGFEISDSYNYVSLPYEVGSSLKILFVLDSLPSDDLHSGRLLSGEVGSLFKNLVEYGLKRGLILGSNPSWMACSFNAYRTAGKPKDFQTSAKEAFVKRINGLLSKYKPDRIVVFGAQASRYLLRDQLELSGGKLMPWLGVPISYDSGSTKHLMTCTLSLDRLLDGAAAGPGVLGHIIQHLASGMNGSRAFSVDNQLLRSSKAVLIDSVAKFDKLLAKLEDATVVSIDTESDNLNRVVNRLLTVQFAVTKTRGYVLPVHHKDTPFTPGELTYIKDRLRLYFEGRNNNKYHVYANATFDLNLLRTSLGARHMANNVWDIFAGEFCLDEGVKFLMDLTGEWYCSLFNLSGQYGFTGYLDSAFSKKDRSRMATVDLDEAFLRYASYDVVVPLAIQEQQVARSVTGESHEKYVSLVSEQLSDQLHTFSRMETNGSKLDVNYLFFLRTPNSPIEQTIKGMEAELLNTPAAKKVNAILQRQSGAPATGLFGTVSSSLLSLAKDAHKQLLFFEVLKLKPVGLGAAGKGKLDKVFQTTYADVPEVSMYTQIGKAKKLRNAYVRSFLKKLASDADLKHDHFIRASYNYLTVVTGRTSASDPNLQQVPSHSELGKQIKRLFIAPQGLLYLKVDYRVHEVRGWSLISNDKSLAAVFETAKGLRDRYRAHPSTELAKRVKTEADVHVMNAAYFFTTTPEAVDKPLRNAVKGVIFGLIYQMSLRTLAKTLGKTLEFTEKLVSNFRKRFPRGMAWIERTKKSARSDFFIENPFGFRRHLWGYLIPKSCGESGKIHADMDRRAVNSPIQGMCSQMMAIGARRLDQMLFEHQKKSRKRIEYKTCNSVHDSLENLFPYRYFLLGLDFVERALVTEVRKVVKTRHNLDFVVDLEIDFELGAALSDCEAWDCSLVMLESIVCKSLVFQRDQLGYQLDVASCMSEVFVDGWVDAPSWMKSQAKNIGWKFDVSKYKET